MSFQQQVKLAQSAGNAGQIAKAHHSYCNVVDYVAGEAIKVGDFAQSSTNENEALSTAGKQITGRVLGIVINDSLKHNKINNATLELQAGSFLQIINAGSVFIETSLKATKGDFVLLDEFTGDIVFSEISEVANLVKTGWRVFAGNSKNERGIVGITTAKVGEVTSETPSPYEVGDLMLKNGEIVKAAEVTSELANDALGVIAFIEQGGGRALLADIEATTGVAITGADAVWWANSRDIVMNNPEAYGATNAGRTAMPTWSADMRPVYKKNALNRVGVDDIDDATKYPAFAYAQSKGEGWMVPSGIALSYIHENKNTINATITALGKTALSGSFITSLPMDIGGLYYRNVTIGIDGGVPDYTGFRENNSLANLGAYADRTATNQNLIAVKVISL